MAKLYMRLAEIHARAEASFKEKADLREKTMTAWQAYEDRVQPTRDKTAKLREQRLAKEEADRASAPVKKTPVKRAKAA